MFFDYYVIEETGEIITKKQFEEIAREYREECKREILEGTRDEDNLPTISEIMLNMDNIYRYEEV